MDSKIIVASFALLAIAFAGAAFAMPGWYDGMMGHGGGQNRTFNGTWNATGHWGGPGMNSTKPNATIVQQFQQAVASGDYQTAKQLHDTYELGGPLFSKLDSTSFSTYSQIYNTQNQLSSLKTQLRQELGPNQTQGNGPMFGGFRGHGFAKGNMMGNRIGQQ